MRILAVLLSSDPSFNRVLDRQQERLQEEIKKQAKLSEKCSLTLKRYYRGKTPLSFSDFLGTALNFKENRLQGDRYDAVLVVFEEDASTSLQEIRDGVFAAAYGEDKPIKAPFNFIITAFSRLLRNWLLLRRLMDSKTELTAAALPSRNFRAAEFANFLHVCTELADSKDFHERVVPALNAVKALRGPKRRSSDQTQYFKDDNSHHYQYGHETHSQFDTGGKHTIACAIRGNYRFGVPLEAQRHFNVTLDGKNKRISGLFINCDENDEQVSATSHINMFSNNFIT
ncbi:MULTISPECIES: hypothetical protein [unclassified Leucobacter]|uniref:hypothetical protein n=1 Tax=unclassified Leucobacter TaxID=2621730 RepID=UPI00165EAF1D|nr:MULTISPECIES: hypothetical protein [unclassified Leucobacter]MBC9936931.1 hypothetical protein [Leucobacter sp. cx-87]